MAKSTGPMAQTVLPSMPAASAAAYDGGGDDVHRLTERGQGRGRHLPYRARRPRRRHDYCARGADDPAGVVEPDGQGERGGREPGRVWTVGRIGQGHLVRRTWHRYEVLGGRPPVD